MSVRTILVCGATGQQGSAVVRSLAAHNTPSQQWKIHAITRDASADKAKALASLSGVELVQGELDHPEVFFAKGPVYGVFFMHNIGNDVAQNKAFAALSAQHGVKHYVHCGLDFSGVAKTDLIPIENPRQSEQDLKGQPFMTTFVRPASFMENFYRPWFVQSVSTTWKEGFQNKTVAVEDIGKAVATIFANPEKFDGRVVNLAGDSHTRDEIIAMAKETTGQVWDFKGTPAIPPYIVKALRFWEEHEFEADPAECRELFPGMTDLKQWFKNSHLPAGGMGEQPPAK